MSVFRIYGYGQAASGPTGRAATVNGIAADICDWCETPLGAHTPTLLQDCEQRREAAGSART